MMSSISANPSEAGRRSARALAIVACALAVAGCSARKFAADRLGAALAGGGSTWGSDDDPELVGAALPFALKTLESLIAESPANPVLLLGACRGFVTYAAGFVEPAGEALPAAEFERARAISARALRLHLRALGYCRRALEARLPGAVAALARAPEGALAAARRDEVELLYWTGAAWGSALALGLDRPELMGDLPPCARSSSARSRLEPGYDRGASKRR